MITKKCEKNHKINVTERHISDINLNEDGGLVGGSPVNNVGSGEVAGLGVGPQGEPGVSKRNKNKVLPFKSFFRRKPPVM